MITQYKTHVLCLLEINPGGFYHAADSILEPIETLQGHFLKEMGVTRENAFKDYNLLPLSTRRDIGMLGLIFKSVHGLAHDDLQQLFPRAGPVVHGYETKLQQNRHNLQLQESRPGTHHALLRRSVFGLTRIWNRLPKDAVSATSVQNFQKMLTGMVRTACHTRNANWESTFSPRPALLPETPHFQNLLTMSALYRI